MDQALSAPSSTEQLHAGLPPLIPAPPQSSLKARNRSSAVFREQELPTFCPPDALPSKESATNDFEENVLDSLQKLSLRHAAAFEKTQPVLTFHPLVTYDNVAEAATMMESHIKSLAPADVLAFALELHRAVRDCIIDLQRAVPTAGSFASSSNPHARMGASLLSTTLSHHDVSPYPYDQSTRLTTSATVYKDDLGMKVVNQYVLLKELGRGAYGKVKLAVNERDEMVAIKVIPHAHVRRQQLRGVGSGANESGGAPADADGPATMEREVALMAKLRHRNVLRLREVINDPEAKNIYLVMNYAERGPLLALRPNGTCTALDFEVARGYVKQLLSGLQYLHAHKVCHRDIKPDNILLGADGVVYFSDFGVSSFLAASSERLNDAAGTPAFHAPEICRGDAFRGPPADVWALGVSFYCMVYGRLPFTGATPAELRRAIIEDELRFPDPRTPTDTEEYAGESGALSCLSTPRRSSCTRPGSPYSNCTTPKAHSPLRRSNNGVVSYGGSGEALDQLGGQTAPLLDTSQALGDALQHLEFQDLLRWMLHKDPDQRCMVDQARRHPFVRPRGENRTRISRLSRPRLSVTGSSNPAANALLALPSKSLEASPMIDALRSDAPPESTSFEERRLSESLPSQSSLPSGKTADQNTFS